MVAESCRHGKLTVFRKMCAILYSLFITDRQTLHWSKTSAMMFVGLTGNIASGKSTVARIIVEQHHLTVIDADEIGRRVVEPGKPAYNQLKQHFGDEYFHSDGSLDRKKLGHLIFADVEQRLKLNSIVHPYIRRQMLTEVLKNLAKGHWLLVFDLPLLFESGLHWFLSDVILVVCNKENQLKRLMKRDNFDEHGALNRMNSQMTVEEKLAKSSFIIENDTEIDYLHEQTMIVVKTIKRRYTNRLIILLLSGCFVALLFWL